MIALTNHMGQTYLLDAGAEDRDNKWFSVTYPNGHIDLYDKTLWKWNDVSEDRWSVKVEYEGGEVEHFDNMDYSFASNIASGKLADHGLSRLVLEKKRKSTNT